MRLETDGISFRPAIPKGMSPVAVYDLPYRQAVLEIHITGEGRVVRRVTINGRETGKIPSTASGQQVVVITMGSE